MKNPFKFAAIASLLALGAFATQAASSLPTNAVQSISIQLTAVSTGTPTTAHDGTVTTPLVSQTISTKDVIKALGGSATAQLLLVGKIQYTTTTSYTTNHSGKVTTNTTTTGRASNSSVVLLDGGVTKPVTNITSSTISTNVSVASSKVSGSGVLEAQESLRIDTFTLTTPTLSFQVGGLSVKTVGSQSKGSVKIYDSTESATVAGTFVNGTVAGICSGAISTKPPTLE